jgi:hypothetical protein
MALYIGVVVVLGIAGVDPRATIAVALVAGTAAAAWVRAAGRLASWLGAGLVIFLLGAVPSFALWLASGPGLAGGYHDAMIGVRNLSASEAILQWRWPGVFGTPVLAQGGTMPIDPCEAAGKSYPSGDHVITITSRTMTRSFAFSVPSSRNWITQVRFLVQPDGRVEETSMAQYDAAECPSEDP